MNKTRTAMILAAGLGTRLKELTHDKPKALVEIKGKTLLQRTIEALCDSGFERIVINIHHFGEQIIDFVASHHFPAEIYISDERQQLMDTGGGILQALPLFSDSEAVLVHNVDVISNVDLKGLYEQFLHSSDAAWLLTQDRETNRKLLFDETRQLIGWKNKNSEQYKWVNGIVDDYTEMAFSGLHLFRPTLFATLEKQPTSIIDLYLQLARNHAIRSHEITPSLWFDLGKIEQIETIIQQIK